MKPNIKQHKKIRYLREKEGLSFRKIADKLGKRVSTIYEQYKEGRKNKVV